MKVKISPKWYRRAAPAKADANLYASKYARHPFVTLNFSLPSATRYQPKLIVDIGPAEARELAAQLLRHAATIDAEQAQA